jgi:hypothetical protein
MLALSAAVVALSATPATLQNASPQIPIANAFIRNNGQWDPEARFLARTGGLDFWVTGTGFTLDFHHIVNGENNGSVKGHVVKVDVVGASGAASNGVNQVPGYVNYLIGQAENWVTNVPRFEESRSVNLVNGVDARYYFDNGAPRYDLVIRPGANPANLKLSYSGAENLRVENGVLKYDTSFGTIEERGLFVYQRINGSNRQVGARQVINEDGTVSFQLANYDSSKPVIIDPVIWSTYLGGTANDQPRRNVMDGTGAHYLTGTTLSADFPVTAGAYDVALGGASDAFVSKLSPDASSLVYSTYLGGTTGMEEGNGLALFNSGAVAVVGRTSSGASFPAVGTQLTAGGGVDDAFLSVLNAAGTAATYSSKLGGSLHDQANNVLVNNNLVVIVGETTSTNFPARTPNPDLRPFQIGNAGGQDAFITEVNLTTSRVNFSTYCGGTGTDTATDLVLVGGLPIVSGTTTSPTFPDPDLAGKPGYSKTNAGGTDAWLLGVAPNWTTANFWTFFGGSGNETAPAFYRSSAAANIGEFYLAGSTSSTDLPIVAGYQNVLFGFAGGYIARFNPDTSVLSSSTYYRASDGAVEINDIQPDSIGAPIVIGRSSGRTLKLGGLDADRTRRGGSDVFVSRFSPLLNIFWHGTYLGGNNDDWASSIAVRNNQVAAAGWTNSTILPNTTGKYQSALSGENDGYLALVSLPVSFTQFNVYSPISPYRWPIDVRTDAGVYTTTDIAFTSDQAVFPLPATTTIPTGLNKSATISVTPSPAGALQTNTTVNLTATALGMTLNKTLILSAPVLSGIDFSANEVAAGVDVTATVLLATSSDSLYVPVGLALVDATSGDPIAPADAFLHKSNVLTFPAGSTSAIVYIRSVARDTDLSVKIKGPSGFMSAPVLLRKTGAEALELSRGSIRGGTTESVSGTVRLTSKAKVGGQVVNLSVDAGAVKIPVSVTVPAGATSAKFTITAAAVAVDTLATVTAEVNGTTATNSFTVAAPVLTDMKFDFANVKVGGSQRGRVYTDINAPAGGLTVTFELVSPASGVTVPTTVTIPGGTRTSPNFFLPVNAGVGAPTTVTIRATLNGVSVERTFNVTP